MSAGISKTNSEPVSEKDQDESAVQIMAHAGPLPHPALLEAYERIVPGGAERIFRQFEMQAAHRQTVEKIVIRSNSFVQIFGALSAFLLGMTGIAGGLYLVLQGRSVEGLSAFLAALASLLGVYVYGKRTQMAEREDKEL